MRVSQSLISIQSDRALRRTNSCATDRECEESYTEVKYPNVRNQVNRKELRTLRPYWAVDSPADVITRH